MSKTQKKTVILLHIFEKCVSRRWFLTGRVNDSSLLIWKPSILLLCHHSTKVMKAMSFNENNYSLNYLIWDQETNSSTSTFFCSVDDDKKL